MSSRKLPFPLVDMFRRNNAFSALPPRTRSIALIVAAAFFMQLLDSSIINTSLPQMARSFGIDPLFMSMGVTIYLLSAAIFIPASAWLAERFGARRIFFLAICIFTLSSLACGAAVEFWQFVLARCLQGVGGALMTPVGRILALRNAEKREIMHITSLIAWPALSAPIIGPVLGGFVTTYLSWRWNFLINLPIGLLGLWLVARFVPRGTHRGTARRFDTRGFFLCAFTFSSLLCGLESIVHGLLPPLAGAGLALGGAAGALVTWRHFATAPSPLLDIAIFRIRTFAISTTSAGIYQRIMINATPFLLPLMFQVAFGLTAAQAGALLIAYFAGNLAMKLVTTPLLRGFGFRALLFVNGLACALSMAGLGLLQPDAAAWLICVALFIAGLSRSLQFTAMNTLAFADLEAAERSTASSITSMLQQLTMLIGVALAVLVLHLSSHLRAAPEVEMTDFRLTFLVMGALGLVSSLAFLKLEPADGAEVSGHGERSPVEPPENIP